MAGRDIDLLARKLVTLERQQTATSRATQLALSSVRLLDGSSVAISGGLEDAEGTTEDLGILNDYTNDIAGSLDEAIDFNDNVYDWIGSSAEAGEIAWDATEYAVDLANELEEELGNVAVDIDQAKLDIGAAKADIAQAQQDLIDAEAELAQARVDIQTAQDTADAAQSESYEALLAANGKNKVYFTDNDTPPTAPASGFVVGDTWFATEGYGERVIYRWGGTAWMRDVAFGSYSILDASITNAKIANLDAAKITSGYLNANRIEALSISAEKLAANSVTADKIVAGAVVAGKLAADSVVADNIVAGSIVAGKLAADSVVAENIVGGTITGDKLVGLTITGDKIAANAITAGKIQAQAIDGMTITGALIRTAPSGQRMQLDANGLRAFNSTGTVTAALSSSAGGLALAGSLVSQYTSSYGETVSASLGDAASVYGISYGGTYSTSVTVDTSGIEKNGNGQSTLYIRNNSASAGSGVSISTYKESGIFLDRSGPITFTATTLGSSRTPKILWSGGIFMHGNQTANLNENISEQLSGVVLVWSAYADGAPTNSSWNHVFVPKNQVQYASSAGVINNLMGWKTPVWKYVYMYNNRITGHADNSAAPNNTQVLRYVIGV